MSEVPLRRMSGPEDIAGTVAWLLSPDARGVTGQAIDHNGGAFMSVTVASASATAHTPALST